MAGLEGWGEVKEALPSRGAGRTQRQQEMKVSLNALLWNIHGDTSRGMAKARRMLVSEVVKESNPDVLLLQEVDALPTLIKELSTRRYAHHHSTSKTEAVILFDKTVLQLVEEIDLVGIIGDNKLRPPESYSSQPTRQGQSPDKEFYGSRVCAIRLRHVKANKEFVLMSFHNASTRTGGREEDIALLANGFFKLVDLVQKNQKVPVIAGGDFNIDLSQLKPMESGCVIPEYESSRRRKTAKKMDLFITKDSTRSSIKSSVEVHQALPLADHTSAEADMHFLKRNTLRHLVDNAPDKNKDGTKMTREDYNKITNHDPTRNKVTF